MSIVWIENLTINERPRSTQVCAHCRTACIEAIPRARLSFMRPDSGEQDSAHLHISCVAGFASSLLKEHAKLYKDALKQRSKG
jgi:CDP-diacylglycerol pyrophosphatase